MEIKHDLEFIVYLVFGQPKTQSEAVQAIYQKDYKNIDMRPFRESRNRLQEKGLLEDDGTERNVEYEAVGHDLSVEDLKSRNLTERNDSGRLVLKNEEKYTCLLEVMKVRKVAEESG
jgi:hypothetical protein